MFGDVTVQTSSSATTAIKYTSCRREDQRLSTEGKIDRFKLLQQIKNSGVGWGGGSPLYHFGGMTLPLRPTVNRLLDTSSRPCATAPKQAM